MNITSDDFINKKIETKHKLNQIHLLSVESVLGANCRIPFIHISKRKNYIEEANERINEFSFAYMFNPTLHTNKVFKEKVKACLSNTFGADTNKHINNILLKLNTRVIALVVHYEHEHLKSRKLLKVLSCVICKIIDRYVCIDYLCTEIKNKSNKAWTLIENKK